MAVIFNNDRPWGAGLFDFNAPTQGTVPDQYGAVADAGGARFSYFLNNLTGERVFPTLPANRLLIQTADDITVRVAGNNLTRDGNGELLGGTIRTLSFNEGLASTDAFIFGLAVNAAGYRAAAATPGGADDLAFVQGLLGGNDLVSLSALNDVFNAGSGTDVIFSNAGSDRLLLGAGNDAAVGGTGNDTIAGGGGNDLIIGNAGRDVLSGGLNRDTIEGGTGADRVQGDSGADVFVFRGADGRDVILDFELGLDRINILNGATSFVQIVVTDVGLDTHLGIGSTIVVLKNIDAAALTPASFTFLPDSSAQILDALIQNTDFVL